jgi:hypothetical protein
VALRSRQPIRRALSTLTLGATSALGTFSLVSGCGTSAQGVEDCRAIEQARCTAAAACGLVEDAPQCQRFYRDHCLHGLPVVPPPRTAVEQCVAALDMLGQCVRAGAGKDAELVDCGVPTSSGTLACEVIRAPELAHACSFLTGKPTTPAEGGQGGEGGNGG